MPLIQKNPITMLGRITRCWLLTYSTPEASARALLPSRLEPVTVGGFAFWNVVVCELARMRSAPLPGFLGIGYRHAAYRIYARFAPPEGDPFSGLYFVRSDADSGLMTAMGNWLTDYRFHDSPIKIEEGPERVRLEVASKDKPGFALIDRLTPPTLREGSPFASIEEAETFLKYEPAGIGVDRSGAVNIVRITRDESQWRSRLVRVEESRWDLLQGQELYPEVCYEVPPIDYRWNRAEIYP